MSNDIAAKATDNDPSNIVDLTAPNVTVISPGTGHGSCNKATPSNKPVNNTVKVTGNDPSNIVDLTAADVTGISPGNGHGSRDKATPSNKSVRNTAKEVKATGNDPFNIMDITVSMVASDDNNGEIVEAQILNSDTKTEKSNDDLAKEKIH